MRKLIVLLASAAASAALAAQTAQGSMYRAPAWFDRQATCVHQHEEHWYWRWTPSFHPLYSYWNGYYTGMQFAGSTWERANRILHRRDSPRTGNRRIVILHAWAIVRHDGGSWREWRGTADRYCGLPVY
jgi:hypothetical protein